MKYTKINAFEDARSIQRSHSVRFLSSSIELLAKQNKIFRAESVCKIEMKWNRERLQIECNVNVIFELNLHRIALDYQ